MPLRLRRSATLLLAALVLSACEAAYHPTAVPGSEARMSVQARRYVDSALYLMESYSLHKHEIDWARFREETYMRANGAEIPAHTYPALSQALRRLDEHSFFSPPSTAIVPPRGLWPDMGGAVVAGRFGYVRTQRYGGSDPDGHAQAYHDLIRGLDTGAVCGWIVDMQGNPGGNMWPMLAGVGPVLGEGRSGTFIDADSVRTPWFYADGAAGIERGGQRVTVTRVPRPYRLRRENPPVAVLTGINTASAAEAVVIAFRGRPGSRSFGGMTAGLPTANTSYEMRDGAYVVLTTAWEADRNGVVYKGRIAPEEPVIGAGGDAANAAMAWLAQQPACQESAGG
ncbi:MAG TPA: S41 family peptidase [Longimicrobium sp.]